MKVSCKKWPENGSDPNVNKHESSILKYNANQDELVEQKGETPKEEEEKIALEEEKKPKTPS